MLYNKLLTSILMFFLAFGTSQEAFATSWFDFAQSAGTVTISGAAFPDTTSLSAVKVVCPATGFLVAQGSAQIQLEPVAAQSYVQGGISITTDNSPPYAANPNHFNSIVLNTNNGVNGVMPSFIQRIDSCAQGQTFAYRFVAWRENAGVNSVAFQPRLVVQFFSNRI